MHPVLLEVPSCEKGEVPLHCHHMLAQDEGKVSNLAQFVCLAHIDTLLQTDCRKLTGFDFIVS